MIRSAVVWVVYLLIAAVFFFGPFGEKGSFAMELLGSIAKGSRVGMESTSDDDETINESPAELAQSANLDQNTYSLARGISSEEGNSTQTRQAAVAFVMRNNAGGDITGYMTGGGPYGRQGGSRPVASWEDPYEGHVKLANLILSGQLADFTNGATNFYAPKTQDALHAKNPDKYRSAEGVDTLWQSRGWVPVEVAGIDESTLKFYRA